ncbi:FecR family protein [Mucilaginibacter pineti]|uniref:FecR family protein n=1 Tax=Mucilaginibacter pineti TaxID=1391627 RepID=A0A1G7E522_9SPHI|nr:FecR family protein [Mucilaginibacter pineti]SDE58797.1 FecR family protein [Mucilaginibacter pineti]
MTTDQSRLQDLLTRYAENSCTREELLELFTMIKDAGGNESLKETLAPIWETIGADDKIPDLDRDRIYENIMSGTPVRQMHTSRKWIRYAAAAILLFSASIGFYLLNRTSAPAQSGLYAKKTVSEHEHNKAVLTLSDGSHVTLNSKRSGVIATQNQVPVNQSANGEIAYQPNVIPKSLKPTFNILATPLGGQYAITLIDGTKVWLNAMSSLKYPVTFTGNERRVELSGEGYFEVAKNKSMPFIVTVNNSEVKVYGTHFNIMGYASENSTGVTLLEGSVKVTNDSRSKMLLPGQQAAIKDHMILISPADGEQAIAWKNGNFNFAHERIDVIMRKLSRWFDIDVSYQGEVTREGFVGTLPRSTDLAQILKTLELTGLVHFKVNGRSVTVMP